MEAIYERPADYDLEHEGDDEDVRFYMRLVASLRPRRVLELACGSGRVTIPLAQRAARDGFEVVGLDIANTMLAEAERKRAAMGSEERARVTFMRGDVRCWRDTGGFDLIISPCGSLSHLLTIDDQVAAWACAYQNLCAGGRFVVDVPMPNLAVYAESLHAQPRTLLELDIDTRDPVTNDRLVRYKTTRYLAHEQRAAIRFLYDKFPDGCHPDRYVSDFECHVYYPRELDLLFRLTGFAVERRYGDYQMHPLAATSRALVVVGRRPGAD